jgi:hypothetical protein
MKPTPGIYWLIPFLIIPHQELIENIKKNSYCQANFKIAVYPFHNFEVKTSPSRFVL